MNPNTKKLVGAIVAAALAIAVYYGLIDQKQANNIQTQANQSLGTGAAPQQSAGPTQAPANAQPPAKTSDPAPQNAPVPPRQ